MKLNIIVFILIVSVVWVECLLSSDFCLKDGLSTCRGKHRNSCGLQYCATDLKKCRIFLEYSLTIRSFKPMGLSLDKPLHTRKYKKFVKSLQPC